MLVSIQRTRRIWLLLPVIAALQGALYVRVGTLLSAEHYSLKLLVRILILVQLLVLLLAAFAIRESGRQEQDVKDGGLAKTFVNGALLFCVLLSQIMLNYMAPFQPLADRLVLEAADKLLLIAALQVIISRIRPSPAAK